MLQPWTGSTCGLGTCVPTLNGQHAVVGTFLFGTATACSVAGAWSVLSCSLAPAAHAQVVNSEDLTEILGERPYRSSELRNIDKFRDGFAKKVGSAAAAVADAASAAAEEAARLGKQVAGGGAPNVEHMPNLEGKIVAT